MKNKKVNDKKIYMIFIIVMVALFGAGYLIGSFVAKLEKSYSLEEIMATIKETLAVIIPPLFVVLAVAFLIAVFTSYNSCKRMYRKLQDDPDDELWDVLENKMNVPMILANVMQIANVFFIGCILSIVEFAPYGKEDGLQKAILIMDVILFVLLLVTELLISKGVVDMEKKLNPEKQGNVFDFKFNEVWFSSCDEAQKMITYQAAYQAFKGTNTTCVILCFLSLIGVVLFQTGIYPMLCICAIWLVNNLSYMLRAAKLEKGENK